MLSAVGTDELGLSADDGNAARLSGCGPKSSTVAGKTSLACRHRARTVLGHRLSQLARHFAKNHHEHGRRT